MSKLLTSLLMICLTIGTAQAQVETYTALLSGANEVPPNSSTGTGTVTVTLNALTGAITVAGSFSNLTSGYTNSHIHGPAAEGANAGVIQGINDALTVDGNQLGGTYDGTTAFILSPTNMGHLRNTEFYIYL